MNFYEMEPFARKMLPEAAACQNGLNIPKTVVYLEETR